MTAEENVFLAKVAPAAMACERATGVPASITIAQAILESSRAPLPGEAAGAGWGKSRLALAANNYFGVKAIHGEDYAEFSTPEYENGKRVMIEAEFAKYPTVEASFVAHGSLLSRLQRYAPAMAVKGDRAAFAQQLQKCGYSTSPTYASTLMILAREFDLAQFDAAPAPVGF